MKFSIDKHPIGTGTALIIAELSANHNQDKALALRTIKAAAEAGADAIKLQTYTADTLTLDCAGAPFQIKQGPWQGETLHSLYQKAYTPWSWHAELKHYAEDCGLICFSSPFDISATDFLARLGMPAYKIASFELVDLPLIDYVARQGKPMILSTGMASQEEIQEALDCARNAGCQQLALLLCTSAYPADPANMHLRTLFDMQQRFGVAVGLSDHSLDSTATVAAISLGACIIEKHFILDRALGGPDAGFSLMPAEFAAMVTAVRNTEQVLGSVHYGPTESEQGSLRFRRSLFVSQAVKAGDAVSADNVRSVRPADGLPPKHWPHIQKRHFVCDLPAGTPLQWQHLGD